jgi:hypothetical protein
MNDERLGLGLGAWMKEAEFAPPDSRRSARQVATRLPQTRQLGRRWWLPSFQRGATTPPTTDQTTDFQPTSIPATNGHSPTVTGRTPSMFSPVKAITAGALVFALGGVLLIAQPFDQQGGSLPGAATDGAREAPVEFSGRLMHGLPIEELSSEAVDGDVEVQREVFRPHVLRMSDPRLNGEAILATESRVFGGEDGITVFSKAFRIENDAGAWQEVPGFVMQSSPGWTSTFIGEGDYAGLFAIADVLHDADGWDLHGFILDGDVPTDPTPASLQ